MSQDAINLSLEPRKTIGKAVKHLRNEGIIPAVIHDHGKPSIHVQGEALTMLKVWHQAGKHHAIGIKLGDNNYTALIKSATFDPKKHHLVHIVFNAVDRDQKVEAGVPIRALYNEGSESSPAERSGLIVLTQLESVEVRATPSKLPDFLEYDGEKLIEVGDHISIADLIVPEGVEILTEPEHAVATVYEPSALAAANDAAAGEAEAGEEPKTLEGAETEAQQTSSESTEANQEDK